MLLSIVALITLNFMIFSSNGVVVNFWTESVISECKDEYFAVQSDENKYVQYVCTSTNHVCGGWADRLKGILASYALSLILDRKFLIKITQPCHIESILEPNKVDWLSLKRFTSAASSPSKKLNAINFNMRYNYDLMKQFETIDVLDYFELLNERSLINVGASIMFSDSFAKNPHLRQRLVELGYANQSAFMIHRQLHKWYNELFRLTPLYQRKYDKLLRRAKPTNDTFLVCAQVRTGGSTAGHKFDDKFMDSEQSTRFWHFINETFVQREMMRNGSFRIFLTTDNPSVRDEAERAFGKQLIVYNQKSPAHFDKDYANLGANCESIDSVIIDFSMLQNCDASVVSHSGFGLLGTWNRDQPSKNLFVFTQRDQRDLVRDYRKRDNLEFKQITNLDSDLYFI